MATGRDFVEASSAGKRRLVTAFVSGAADGHEVEPGGPGRAVAGGAGLAALLMAGAAVVGVLAPGEPSGWTQPGLVVSRETGAAYVILPGGARPVLRPVADTTSARLALGPDAAPRIVSQSAIDEQTIGPDLGIDGAPATLPGASDLVLDGWTACTGAGAGVRVAVTDDPRVRPVPGGGFVVRSGGDFYVVAQAAGVDGEPVGAHRYRLPATGSDQDNLLDGLGLAARSAAVAVPGGWLSLFPPGGDLGWDSFAVPGLGDPVARRGSLGVPVEARVGDVVTTRSESLLLTAHAMVPLDGFSLAVYRNTVTPTGRLGDAPRVDDAPVEWRVDRPPSLRRWDAAYVAPRWPASTLRPVGGGLCAVLDTAPGGAASVGLASHPVGDASPVRIPAGRRSVRVQPGRAALALSGGWGATDHGAPFVVDARGRSHRLEGDDTLERLGYADVPGRVVPRTWVALFDDGVPLSVDAALCPGHYGPRCR